jgi:NADH dehydrogenase (ubiquinone) Fe-S protein 3
LSQTINKTFLINDRFLKNIKFIFQIKENNDFYQIGKNEFLLIKIQPEFLFPLIVFLKYHSLALFNILSDITAFDYSVLQNSILKRFHLRYLFLSTQFNSRISIGFSLSQLSFAVFSISTLFKNAMWCERELWDMYGLIFVGNFNLRRLLTDYGFRGFPLRKDFPLTGFFEIIYNSSKKKILYEKVELSQSFRIFHYWKIWK